MSEELTGFTPVTRLSRAFTPQSLQVPTTKADAIAAATNIIKAMWETVEAGLSPKVEIELIRQGADVICRISPWNIDGVTKTVANPGDWLTVDGTTLAGMNADEYAAEFTKNVPIEWDATSSAPTATAGPGRTATVTWPQPTSANRPFTYALTVMDHTAGRNMVPIIAIDAPEPPAPATAKLSNLPDEHEFSVTVTVNTQYETSAKSAASNRFTAFDQPPAVPSVTEPDVKAS